MAVVTFHRVGKIPRPLFLLVFVVLALISVPLRCGYGLCGLLGDQSIAPPAADILVPKRRDVELVVGKLKREDTQWVAKFLPWVANIYVVDDPKAKLTVAVNKGREAMVYLTYIIDRYDSLPDTTVFVHASRFQWHNDNPDYDNLLSLRNLSLPYIQQEGYVNLRCVWVLGCPREIRPVDDERLAAGKEKEKLSTKDIYKKAFEEFMPNTTVPGEVGVPCCSQFAVSSDTIRQRPKEDYVRIREWLTNTHLDDDLSGRVLEYSWHIIFGKEAVHCPSAADCYCKLYGLCGLNCTSQSCDGRYTLPPYSTLPNEWPMKGWEGETRQYESPF